MSLKGGVIIIGSLLWDTKTKRQNWRGNDLCYENRFQVYLPIRYGRCSRGRDHTYTMVFSTICYSRGYGLGTGWILPIKTEINSFNDLKKEAQKMGRAEYLSDGLSSNWGAVALLLNPNKEINNVFKVEWKKLMAKRLSNHPIFTKKLKSEESSIGRNGFLTIRWPGEVIPKNRIEELDFLIATAIKPTLVNGRYPTTYQIADAMSRKKYYVYFLKNRQHKITTFQDERILRRINQKKLKEKSIINGEI